MFLWKLGNLRKCVNEGETAMDEIEYKIFRTIKADLLQKLKFLKNG